MKLNYSVSRLGKPLCVDDPANSENGLPALYFGLGRGAQISSSVGMASIWLVHKGQAQITFGNGIQSVVCEGQLVVSLDNRFRIASCGDAYWLGLSTSMDCLHRLLSESSGFPMALQPCLETADTFSMQLAQTLVASAQHDLPIDEDDHLNLVSLIFRLENNARDQINRCPGRTDKARRLAHYRLIKAKARIAANPNSLAGIGELAAISNYSVWHFIRIFSRVFGETPMEHAHRLRMSHAVHLIKEGRLSVSEVSREAGFETFSAFCRSFRDEFGTTVTQFRERAITA